MVINKYVYSQDEIDIILSYYPEGGSSLCKQYLPDKSIKSIQYKANILGLTTNIRGKFKKWKEEDLEIIKTYYPIGGKILCKKYLPDKTLQSIWQVSRRLNLDYKYKNLKSWTPIEIEFLISNYSTQGAEWCAKNLNKNKSSIITKATSIGLKLDSNYLITPKGEVRYRDFSNIFDLTNPKIIYLLGFIWADGCVNKTVVISNVSEDLDEIIQKLDLENLLPGISIKYRQPQRNGWKPQTIITFGDKQVISFFKENNYVKSRILEPVILENIPDNLKYYWFRGYLDGDGCIYVSKQYRGACLSFTGHYESTYKFLEKLGSDFRVTPRVDYRISKDGRKFSRVTFDTLKRAVPILDYIYQDWDNYNLGLNRKYEKYRQVKQFINI